MATTRSLSFSDGFQTLILNEDENRRIMWNPSDVGFVDRFISFQNWVEDDFKPRVQRLNLSNRLEDYEQGAIAKMGEELCGAIDTCFKAPVSEAAFVGVNPLSPISNGKLLFINFLEALMPLIESSVKDFDKARQKYTQAAKKVVSKK